MLATRRLLSQKLRRVVFVCGGLLATAVMLPAGASATTVSFASTGAEQTFTVPAGVSSLHVVAVGGRGGDGGSGATAGLGAQVSVDLSVTPGQVLYVEVGGNGATGSTFDHAGGFNGGGNGGGIGAGAGGGGSDIRSLPMSAGASPSLASRLIVAGGGGGGSGTMGGAGGAGGAAGGNGSDGANGFSGGGAGTSSMGGGGGGGGSNSYGYAGAFGQGGAGGPANGGGGGGGYYGGGGGGGNYGGGGGGGSNFTGSASNPVIGADTSGTPSVVITYTATVPPAPGSGGNGGGAGTGNGSGTGMGAPAVSGASESAKTWIEGDGLPVIARKRKLPVGTTISFGLNQPAAVRFDFTQSAGGRKVGGKCVAPTIRNKRKHTCTRTVVAATLLFAGHAGMNRVRFQGRVSRFKRLKPGRYTLAITATSSGGQRSAPQSLSFTIAKK